MAKGDNKSGNVKPISLHPMTLAEALRKALEHPPIEEPKKPSKKPKAKHGKK